MIPGKNSDQMPPESPEVRPQGESGDGAGNAPAPEDGSAAPPYDNGNGTELARSGQDEGLRELIAGNFIEYASYVIKDRAIPDINDGLKPVQRRILHSLYELDDGRFHKVANVIGHTMRYHPHGDASIGSALVVLANKEYFIEKQGNFGNIYTGDQASAARYIECRLTPLAREVLFNPEITEYMDSYDGRNREPVTLPAKVPALLMLGAEGIAVGMSTRILPHNFRELLEAQIAILEDKPFALYPDFQTGGVMDVADYDDGRGRVRVRAHIEAVNRKTLVIRELPAGTTTESLIASIENAARKGQLKIASIHDYTAEKPEIEIRLARGEHAPEALKRLFAYTDCEVTISSNIIVIKDQRPVQMTVSEILRYNTEKLVRDLRRELEIKLHKLQERFHEKTLVQIFIENRIYKRIEEAETWEKVVGEVRKGLEPFRHMLRRDVTDEDIEKLLQIQIRRISRFDIERNKKELDDITRAIEETQDNLAHIVRYTIGYIRGLLDKYGDQYPRRTKIADLEMVRAREVALENLKVGHDRVNKFVGIAVKNSNKNEPYLVCSEYDHLVLLRNDGAFKVIQVPEKEYVGPVKYLLKADKNQVYSMIYRDRKTGKYYAKRFSIAHYILNREYRTIPSGCIIENLYTNSGVVVRCEFEPKKRSKVTHVDVAFDEIPLRSTGARGFKIADRKIISFVQIRRGTAAPEAGEEDERTPAGKEQADEAAAQPASISPESAPGPDAMVEQGASGNAADAPSAPAASPESEGVDSGSTETSASVEGRTADSAEPPAGTGDEAAAVAAPGPDVETSAEAPPTESTDSAASESAQVEEAAGDVDTGPKKKRQAGAPGRKQAKKTGRRKRGKSAKRTKATSGRSSRKSPTSRTEDAPEPDAGASDAGPTPAAPAEEATSSTPGGDSVAPARNLAEEWERRTVEAGRLPPDRTGEPGAVLAPDGTATDAPEKAEAGSGPETAGAGPDAAKTPHAEAPAAEESKSGRRRKSKTPRKTDKEARKSSGKAPSGGSRSRSANSAKTAGRRRKNAGPAASASESAKSAPPAGEREHPEPSEKTESGSAPPKTEPPARRLPRRIDEDTPFTLEPD